MNTRYRINHPLKVEVTSSRFFLLIILLVGLSTTISSASDEAKAEEIARDALMTEIRAERHTLREELHVLRERFADNDEAFSEAFAAWRGKRNDRLNVLHGRLDAASPVSPGPERRPVQVLPEGADEATILHFQLREEMLAVRERAADLPPEKRHEAVREWRQANGHRFEEASRLAARRDAAERATRPVPPSRDFSGLPPKQRALLEARDEMRRERLAIMTQYRPDQEEERQAAILAWHQANEERFENLRRLTDEAASEERAD